MNTAVETFEGGCRCGKVRYKCSSPPRVALHCHCRDCQYASGGAFSTIVVCDKSAVELSGELNGFTVTADSGNQLTRKFCPTCGSPILTELSPKADVLVLKAGTLDDPSWLKPTLNIWKSSGQPWCEEINDLPKFEKNAS